MFIKQPDMISKIQNTFNIQDLAILSGVKAHTIRTWEKRYGLLNPARLNRGIRSYSILELQKLLNVSLLLKHDYKISELAKLVDVELEKRAKTISLDKLKSNYYINSIMISMFSLDEELFEEVFQENISTESFSDVFRNTYIPLLNHIGALWQTNSLKPANERFISNLIYQKILLQIADIPKPVRQPKRVNVLFLPEGEMHEIGLLFLLYHLKLSGEKTIYLGRSIPTDNLFEIKSKFKDINWVTSFVIDRTDKEKARFISDMEELLIHTKNTCRIVGKVWSEFSASNKSENIHFYEGFDSLIID